MKGSNAFGAAFQQAQTTSAKGQNEIEAAPPCFTFYFSLFTFHNLGRHRCLEPPMFARPGAFWLLDSSSWLLYFPSWLLQLPPFKLRAPAYAHRSTG